MCTKPQATIRTTEQDFRVEEVALYEPVGHGAHVFARVRKTGWSTAACVRHLAKALDLSPRDFGHAGLKDRHAVTVQTLSFPWLETRELPSLASLTGDGIEVLSLKRHPHKLRIGHLASNQFDIVLRGIRASDYAIVMEGFETVSRRGVPNAFGPQRYGRECDNVEQALAWIRDKRRGHRDKRVLGLMLSSVQSAWFDTLLRVRVENATYDTVIEGDIVKKLDGGGLFVCADEHEDARRASIGEVVATGPIYGARMRWPSARPQQWEREVLNDALASLGGADSPQAAALVNKLGPGSRRALRVVPQQMRVTRCDDAVDAAAVSTDAGNVNKTCSLHVHMLLPKGTYATTILSSVVNVCDASKTGGENENLAE